MDDISITVTNDVASDSWGFVGVVKVGDVEAYRTLEAFPTPRAAQLASQDILAGVLGELLAGAEWRKVREEKGSSPTRRDLSLGVFDSQRPGLDPSTDRAGEDAAR
jgi:hypothetical protein